MKQFALLMMLDFVPVQETRNPVMRRTEMPQILSA